MRRAARAPPSCALARKANPSALGELERAACLGPAVLLALDDARVAGQEAAVLQGGAQVRLEIGQRLGNAVTHRPGLAREAAARDRADPVILALPDGADHRLVDPHALHRPRN